MEPVGAEIDDFDYPLKQAQIAQRPADPRDSARLLDARDLREVRDHTVADLPDLLMPGDVLVVNNTKVRRARLRLRKETGGAAEVLLLAPTGDPGLWTALVKPSRRLPTGTVLFDGSAPVVELVDEMDGTRLVRILDQAQVERVGVLPLPPYIRSQPEDPDRYQTVYAQRPGSVAAPTAGLHFTDGLIQRCREAGAAIATVDLEVGLGTFAPVTAERLDDHVMHSERFTVAPGAWSSIVAADRVVAVGTTVVRTLETVAATGSMSGTTDIFIRPGFQWKVVDLLLTNFHMPRSTLLVLVEAFIGPDWRELYAAAIDRGYSVGSFGDAMLLDRHPPREVG
ncbi:MAG: tRNA preQ1(34) S-adenosylmethionine ribosyltransferase-isomerase QueA [Acidimicrobiales bacterium]|nr:tRNA preQ1(34) S-adenosylmethionine ribosyltransferase-isomerase QueA [Acidimicrobiales bacterium]